MKKTLRQLQIFLTFLLLGGLALNPKQQAFAADFYLPPEYSPVQAVLVSQVVLEDENGYHLLRVLLESGIQVWLLAEREREAEVQGHLREIYGFSRSQLAGLHLMPIRTNTLWARDWAPLMLLPRQPGSLPVLGLLDAFYARERELDDLVGTALQDEIKAFALLPDWALRWQRLPLWLEGGNLICRQNECLLGDSIRRRNPGQSDHELKARLAEGLDQAVSLVPTLPYESTGHLDIWLKLLDEQTLMVARIDDQSLLLAPLPLRKQIEEMHDFLDQQALSLAQRLPGVKIVRVPMPLPELEADGQMSYRTYVNSLLVNGQAILPRYSRSAYGRLYRDQKLIKSYEAEVEKVYAQAGYRPVWIEADYLIPGGGAWHCATMQIPALNSD